MERPTMQLTLPDTGIVCELVETLLFGESQHINDCLIDGGGEVDPITKMPNLRFDFKSHRENKLLTIVKAMRTPDGTDIPVSIEAINQLTVADGTLLLQECERILKGEKK